MRNIFSFKQRHIDYTGSPVHIAAVYTKIDMTTKTSESNLKITDEKGNSKKNQLKMKREFLNTLYSSSYTGV